MSLLNENYPFKKQQEYYQKKMKTIVFLFLSSLRTGPFSIIPSPNSFGPSYRENNKRKDVV